MKKIYLFLMGLMTITTIIQAQPGSLGLNNVDGSPFSCAVLTDRGVYKSLKLQATQSSSSATWEFPATCSFPGDVWRPYASGTGAIPFNTTIAPVGGSASALYNSGNGGGSGNLSPITNGNYYVFNIQNVVAPNNAYMSVLETATNPVTITSVTRFPAGSLISAAAPVILTVTTSAAPTEKLYVRYSTDDFGTSNFLPISFTGTTGTGYIPAQTAGTTVKYYVFSSPNDVPKIVAEVGFNGQLAYDMNTLELNNNAGANYSYTVSTSTDPIWVTATNSANDAFYTTLGAAFTAINAGTHTGAINIGVVGNTTETSSAVLNASGSGAASYTSI
ncbi:MAG: hypothetical protein ACOYKE_10610 [Ferruginibacter sp.]